MNSAPGTYALVLRCPRSFTATVGKLGAVGLKGGYYVYVGSAFGPGGVRARVLRHHRHKKRLHWHLDYVRDRLGIVEVWYTHDSQRREHAGVMRTTLALDGPPGFGSSDCRCRSHLLRAPGKPELTDLRNAIEREIDGHGEIQMWSLP